MNKILLLILISFLLFEVNVFAQNRLLDEDELVNADEFLSLHEAMKNPEKVD